VTPLVRVSEQLFDALVGLSARDWRLCGPRVAAVRLLILFSALVGIIPLAHASPPDPSWIPGIYDNADSDDVVGLVADGTAASGGQGPARFAESPATCLVLPDPGQVPSEMLSAEMNRGPP
jgi:hypothetical protein